MLKHFTFKVIFSNRLLLRYCDSEYFFNFEILKQAINVLRFPEKLKRVSFRKQCFVASIESKTEILRKFKY